MSNENAEAYEDLGLYDDFDQDPNEKLVDPNEKLVDPKVEEVEKMDEGAVASALEADDSGSWRPLTSADVNAQQQRQQLQQQYQATPEGLGMGNAPAPIPTYASQPETSNFALPPNNTRYQQNPGVNRYAQEGHAQRRPDFGDEADEGPRVETELAEWTLMQQINVDSDCACGRKDG
ncbi:hypothetical protein QFC21_002657 [Naganishia friedmannii]|uniref:Uncharacterized protein n=1 Tax=Naganishia friedmannii TaxID=89922 RepID=A0ACC2VVZ4_9TREE|nr:hypothetical protein QFC21_002657 [Naganishia friedmannii]